jgi:hypothetical protein
MIAIAFLFVRILCDCFKRRWRLEAEILVLPLAVLPNFAACIRVERPDEAKVPGWLANSALPDVIVHPCSLLLLGKKIDVMSDTP